MVFHNARVGFGAVHHPRSRTVTKRSTCAQGGLYVSPTKGQTLDSAQPVQITWDTTLGCLGNPPPQQIDIYVNAPSISDNYLTALRLNYNRGTYNTTFSSGMWNNTQSALLQLNIVPAGSPPFLTDLPGPVFTMTHDTSLPPAPISTGGFNQIIDGLNTKHISKGGTAAAVLLPLLAVAAAIGIFFKWSREKQSAKSKRWSQAVDKRMSTISTDWKSLSGAGANAAIRSSMANRASSIFGSTGRPSSTLALEGGHAGFGAGAGAHTTVGVGLRIPLNDEPEMAQLRQARASTFGAHERVSRISFAENVQISTGDLRPLQTNNAVSTAATRTYHPRSFDEPRGSDDGIVSPTQAQGPLPLTPDDIRAKISGPRDEDIDGDLLQMPAMTLMRAGHVNSSTDDLILPPQTPSSAAPLVPPSPTFPKSPVGMMPMGPSPAVMSPDEMLRAYADSRRATSSHSNSGMRTLYSPSPATSIASDPFNSPSAVVGTRPRADTANSNNPFRKSMKSMAVSDLSVYSGNEDEEEDPYGGVEEDAHAVGAAQ